MSGFLRGCTVGVCVLLAGVVVGLAINWLASLSVAGGIAVLCVAVVLLCGLIGWYADQT